MVGRVTTLETVTMDSYRPQIPLSYSDFHNQTPASSLYGHPPDIVTLQPRNRLRTPFSDHEQQTRHQH
jgi:hypothetical protein